MRFVAIRDGHQRYAAVLRAEDTVQPLCLLDEFFTDVDGWLASAAHPTADAGMPMRQVTPAPFVPTTARVFCVGLNYRSHADEASAALPDAPTIFGRWTSSLAGHEETIALPEAEPLDWEGELAVVIGRRIGPRSTIALDDAVFGYCAFNDLTARRHQTATTQWTIGKNVDGSGPLGPVVVTSDEFGDPASGRTLETRVNGQVVQRASTAAMIFPVDRLISYICGIIPLLPGDVIATGTPEGVGHFLDPPAYLGAGDVVEVEVEGIGVLRNTIAASQANAGVR